MTYFFTDVRRHIVNVVIPAFNAWSLALPAGRAQGIEQAYDYDAPATNTYPVLYATNSGGTQFARRGLGINAGCGRSARYQLDVVVTVPRSDHTHKFDEVEDIMSLCADNFIAYINEQGDDLLAAVGVCDWTIANIVWDYLDGPANTQRGVIITLDYKTEWRV